ncbi:hypothetical protein A3218_01900 [Pseudomonas chlororaphis]|nr:hypothetical protein A3218_01900 [Pseudomonas chlororaphis]
MANALEEQIKASVAAGNRIQQIETSVSGKISTAMSAARQKQQQKERAKLAPTLRRLAKSGRAIEAASHVLRINLARAYLIANEHAIEFADCESQEESFSPTSS